MKYIIYFLLLIFCFSFSQSIEWSNTIPLSTEDNGVKQIDTDDDGNIYIAGWSGGLNYLELAGDSIVHEPSIKLLKLSNMGELIFENDNDTLSNDGVVGLAVLENGINLTGNCGKHFEYLYPVRNYRFSSFDLDGNFNNYTDYMPPFDWDDYRKSQFINPTPDKGYIYDDISWGGDRYTEELVRYFPQSGNKSFPTLENFVPDTLIDLYAYGWDRIYFRNGCNTGTDNSTLLLGDIGYMGPDYSFIIKLDEQFEIEWQLYYQHYSRYDSSKYSYFHNSIESLNDSTYVATCWVDINKNQDVDLDENYLIIMDGQGNVTWTYFTFDEVIKIEKMTGNDYIVRGLDSETIWKFRYNGTGMDLLWTQTYPDLDILKIIPDGFISSKIIDDELYIFKVKDDTGIDNQITLPKTSQLYSNYPNPFNPVTTLSYSLSAKGMVNLIIYNTKGEIVSELVNKKQNIGSYNIKFDGNSLNSGVYFYQLKLNNKPVDTKRMLLIK